MREYSTARTVILKKFFDADFFPNIENFFRAWNAIGVATQPEPNAGDANGAFYSPVSLKAKNQSRSDASDAYYRHIAGSRDNFHLLTGHAVSKINFDDQKKATSVSVSEIQCDFQHLYLLADPFR